MWHKYEDTKPEEGQRIHAIGLWEGETVGETDCIEETVDVYSKGSVSVSATDRYYALIYKVLYWKDASDLPQNITFSVDYGLEIKDKEEQSNGI